jgi:hypothetical protein
MKPPKSKRDNTCPKVMDKLFDLDDRIYDKLQKRYPENKVEGDQLNFPTFLTHMDIDFTRPTEDDFDNS